jgi:gluconolactonase
MRALWMPAVLAAVLMPGSVPGQVTQDAPAGRPDAIIDLATMGGVRLVKGQWRHNDAKIVEVDHRKPGPDLRPSGPPNRTYDIAPKAGPAEFDDSAWEAIGPTTLEARRGNGRLSFNWYRLRLTIPPKIGSFDPTGSTVVFEVVVDDYSEIWVDGKLPLVLGQAGGAVIKGFNAPNRVVITRDARPGQQIQLAIFGINGPLSNPPGNFIWVRAATLKFYNSRKFGLAERVKAEIIRLDPALDSIVPADAVFEKLATGFTFTEGPIWVPDGYLLFSDPNENAIYRWSPEGQVSVFKTNSGYTGLDIDMYKQPGSNGLTLDGEGRLTINEHGNRRVTRLEKNGVLTVLAERYEGKRFNSPNDLVYKSDGSLYFTDPPFGLPNFHQDPRKELPYSGIFRRSSDGRLQLLSSELKGPNGLAFSPDEKYLYVGNWDEKKKVVMRYDMRGDGTLANGRVFTDLTNEPGEDAIDGVKTDQASNVYVSGPAGLWIFSSSGKALGRLHGPEHPHNFAWGDEDGRTLYLAARSSIYRVRLKIPGVRPGGLGK